MTGEAALQNTRAKVVSAGCLFDYPARPNGQSSGRGRPRGTADRTMPPSALPSQTARKASHSSASRALIEQHQDAIGLQNAGNLRQEIPHRLPVGIRCLATFLCVGDDDFPREIGVKTQDGCSTARSTPNRASGRCAAGPSLRVEQTHRARLPGANGSRRELEGHPLDRQLLQKPKHVRRLPIQRVAAGDGFEQRAGSLLKAIPCIHFESAAWAASIQLPNCQPPSSPSCCPWSCRVR